MMVVNRPAVSRTPLSAASSTAAMSGGRSFSRAPWMQQRFQPAARSARCDGGIEPPAGPCLYELPAQPSETLLDRRVERDAVARQFVGDVVAQQHLDTGAGLVPPAFRESPYVHLGPQALDGALGVAQGDDQGVRGTDGGLTQGVGVAHQCGDLVTEPRGDPGPP
ncbi:hypothetical protein AB0392_04765 [Nonomuraea angiospora]|uniref:hypothetical protein n=1 Tax=Nonomuraea angiospora TaxID=46172 RepID=UPI003451092F